jgi:hypothetical protein
MNRRRESWVREILFIVGAFMIMVIFAFSILRQWPSFDPLVTALLAGIGLLLIVIYERLGVMLHEVQRVAEALEGARVGAQPPGSVEPREPLASTGAAVSPTPAIPEHG